MHKYSSWVKELAEKTMMAGLYKAEKLIKSIDDEEATSNEIEALAHAMKVIHISDTLMHHIDEHQDAEVKPDMTKAAKI